MVERLDVSADATDVIVELGMTDPQVTSLVGLMGGMLGISAPTTP